MSRFSPVVAEHFQSPCNRRAMPNADRLGLATLDGQGPRITLYLRLDGERIHAASFEAFGCGVTIACGSMLTELVQGMSLRDCKQFSAKQLIDALQGLPPDKEYCAHIAVQSLHNAIAAD